MESIQPIKRTKKDKDGASTVPLPSSLIVRFLNQSGGDAGPAVEVPTASSAKQLELVVNSLLGNEETVGRFCS